MKNYFNNRVIVVLIALYVVSIGLTSCDILEVNNTASLTNKSIDDPDLLLTSAEGNVLSAYALTILATGLVSDELMNGTSQTAYIRLDKGFFDKQAWNRAASIYNVYNQLSQGRWVANFALNKIRKIVKDPNDIRIAKAEFWNAFSLVLLADSWKQITLDGKAPITPIKTYKMALSKLKDALSIASKQKSKYQAYILGLLARVDYSLYVATNKKSYLAKATSYAKQALSVDKHFILKGAYNSTDQPNAVFNNMNNSTLPIAPQIVYHHLKDPYSGQEDPRVKFGSFRGLSALGDSVFNELKYPAIDSPIPVVKWQEMNLILAENALMNNNIPREMNYLNKNRKVVGLPAMHTNDRSTARKYLIYERKATFWLEGRRWMDMRHFNLPLNDGRKWL